ncbi:MAG: hypothetical protein BJ554DRAFT_6611, partial [Olpidium bornovanus]
PGSAQKEKGDGPAAVDPDAGDQNATGLAALSRAELIEEANKLTAELNAEKEERNYFQLERVRRGRAGRAELLNKDRELEELEEKHQVEIKVCGSAWSRCPFPGGLARMSGEKGRKEERSGAVYKQKVKHLLYEYQNNVAHLQSDSEHALQLEQEEHLSRETQLKKDKRALKLELKEFELSHEDIVKQIKQKNDQDISKMRADFERRARELHLKYEKKM